MKPLFYYEPAGRDYICISCAASISSWCPMVPCFLLVDPGEYIECGQCGVVINFNPQPIYEDDIDRIPE